MIEIPGYGEYHSPALLGEAENENLLGTTTLKIFGLVLDSLKRELRPKPAILKNDTTYIPLTPNTKLNFYSTKPQTKTDPR